MLVWGMVGQFKCAESGISPLLLCWIAGPSPIGVVLLRRCGDKRDDLLPSRYVLVNVPFVIRRPCPLAGDSLGLVSGGVVFLGLSKLLNQEDAPGVPCLDTVILALRSIRYFEITLRLATPDIRLASADAFAVVGGGCTGRAHGCKAKQGSRAKRRR